MFYSQSAHQDNAFGKELKYHLDTKSNEKNQCRPTIKCLSQKYHFSEHAITHLSRGTKNYTIDTARKHALELIAALIQEGWIASAQEANTLLKALPGGKNLDEDVSREKAIFDLIQSTTQRNMLPQKVSDQTPECAHSDQENFSSEQQAEDIPDPNIRSFAQEARYSQEALVHSLKKRYVHFSLIQVAVLVLVLSVGGLLYFNQHPTTVYVINPSPASQVASTVQQQRNSTATAQVGASVTPATTSNSKTTTSSTPASTSSHGAATPPAAASTSNHGAATPPAAASTSSHGAATSSNGNPTPSPTPTPSPGPINVLCNKLPPPVPCL